MNTFIHISLFPIIFMLLFQQQDTTYYNTLRKPSTYGINSFIKNNYDNLIAEYEYRVDSIYDVYIYADNLTKYEGLNELGVFYLPDEIYITNEEKYIEYEFKNLSRFKQKTVTFYDRTVKAVLFHELTHVYFNQILKIRQNNNLNISLGYKAFRIYPSTEISFGAEFIEEGVCEYVVYDLGEAGELKHVVIPENIEEILDPKNKLNIIYQYSVYVLRDFLDKYGVKEGIEILISNKPPTYEEILKPELFFKRLDYDTRN